MNLIRYLPGARARDDIMRGHERSKPLQVLRSVECESAPKCTRGFTGTSSCNLHRWYRNHSAVIYNTEFISAIVYLTSYPLMGREQMSATRSLFVEQSGWRMVMLGREI